MKDYLLIEQVRHAYGRQQVLPPLSFSVAQGDFVCLLGSSGSGKTTLLRLIAGLERVQTGRVLLEDVVLSSPRLHVAADQRGVGMVFQQPTLFPTLSVSENVAFGIRHQPIEQRMARVEVLLQHVGLAGFGGRLPHQLSGGQQHRVALARALAPSPKLMLLDEPFAHLDAPLRVQLRSDTLALMKEEHVTCMMVTHDPEEAMLMGDQIVVLDGQGRLQQVGTPHDVYHEPANLYAAQALGEVNLLAGVGDGQLVRSPIGDVSSDQLGDVQVVVRPHDCAVVGASQGVAAEIVMLHCAGAHDYLSLKLATGEMIRASMPHTHRYQVGQQVGVRIDAEQVLLFCAS